MKAGFAALYSGSTLIHKSADQEKFLVPSENNSNVVPPFNAYAPSGQVQVSVTLLVFSVLVVLSTDGNWTPTVPD